MNFIKTHSSFSLPTIFEPENYKVDLKVYLDPENQGEHYVGVDPQHFDGVSAVTFTVLEETSQLILNAKYLENLSLNLLSVEGQVEKGGFVFNS